MRCFDSIANLIKTGRVQHPKGYSQSELSHLLGYKNGQFISNVERGLCNIPLKMLNRVSKVLAISTDTLKVAMIEDYDKTLQNFLKETDSTVESGHESRMNTLEQGNAEREFVKTRLEASEAEAEAEADKYLKHG